MIEINLYSIPKDDPNSRVGKCIARNRFDKEAMGVSVPQFIAGFLRENIDKFENGTLSSELISLINSKTNFTRKDIACINYYLQESGLKVQVQNVTDDEDNATGVPSGNVVEWNVIDREFVMNDYPTATKFIPGNEDIAEILEKIVKQSGLFDEDKFSGIKNPFNALFDALKKIKSVSGSINGTIVSRIYDCLDRCGIEVFCATSED